MATGREWGEGREGRRRINGRKQRCCGVWKKGKLGKISKTLRHNGPLDSNIQTLSICSASLQTSKEMCRDNEYPDTLHEITLFYCVSFAVVVLKDTSAGLHVTFVYFTEAASKLNKKELAHPDFEILELRYWWCSTNCLYLGLPL